MAARLLFWGGSPASDVDCAAPFPVDVFGDVGQQREVAERPDHRKGFVDVDTVEHPG